MIVAVCPWYANYDQIFSPSGRVFCLGEGQVREHRRVRPSPGPQSAFSNSMPFDLRSSNWKNLDFGPLSAISWLAKTKSFPCSRPHFLHKYNWVLD